MSPWVLCVVLWAQGDLPPECHTQPNLAMCFQAMNVWLEQARAWSQRSGLKGGYAAQCKQLEVRA
jgi:hypothetical protein